jgi:integrase
MWGYHVWLRQPDGSRKQVRDFSFNTKDEAKEALRAVQTAGRKERYGLTEAKKQEPTSIETAIARYKDLADSKRTSRRSEDTTYWRDNPGHIRTLERFGRWAITERKIKYVVDVDDDIIQFWMAAEVRRARENGGAIKQSTIKRGLNTILAALRGAKESRKFGDLINYHVPKNPLKKSQVEEDRDRVLSPEEITRLSDGLKEKPENEEALFFLQLALMTGGRFAELKRMKWDESSARFGTVKLKSTKTGGKTRTIKVPGAAELISERKVGKLGGVERVLTKEYEWFKETLKTVSESLNIPYGQRVQGGWTIHVVST